MPGEPVDVSWPVIGREEELAFILATVDDPGSSGLVISGDAGVGKTRLVLEALEAVDPQRFRVDWVAATQATATIPFGALAPLLPPGLSDSGVRVDLHLAAETLAAQVEGRRRVIAMDDAHLLDEPSAALLHQMAQDHHAFVLATVRSREPAPTPITALWNEGAAGRLELLRLTKADVEAILTSVLGGSVHHPTLQKLWETTAGNPMMLRELVIAGWDAGALRRVDEVWRWEGPWVVAPRLAELINARLGRLDEHERIALELVAYGEPIGLDLLGSLVPVATIHTLEARELLRIDPSGWRVNVHLGHPLYGEVLRARGSTLRARSRQRELAEAVEATGARRRDDALRIATWRLDSGTPAAPELLAKAARQAWSALDRDLAERLSRAALEAGGGFSAALTLGWSLAVAERPAEAEQALTWLASLQGSDQERAHLAVPRVFGTFFGLNQIDVAFEMLGAVRATVTDPATQAELDCWDALLRTYLGQLATVLPVFRELLDRGDLPPRVHGLALMGAARVQLARGRADHATALLERARETAADWGEELPFLTPVVELLQADAEVLSGRLGPAAARATAAHHTTLRQRLTVVHGSWCIRLAMVATAQGRLRAALRWAQEAVGICRENQGAFVAMALGQVAHAAALLGDAAAAQAALAEADASAWPAQTIEQPWTELARPWVAAAHGWHAEAVRAALGVADGLRHAGFHGFEPAALHAAVRLDAADAVAGRLGTLATSRGQATRLVVLYAEHAVAAARRNGGALDEVADGFERLGAKLLAAEAAAQAAAAHRAAGLTGRADASARRALSLAAECDQARTPALQSLR